MIAFLQRLRRNRRGATIIEFAIVAPVMIFLIMGLGDVLYQAYTQSILNGSLQKAGRDSGIEGNAANSATIDAKVTTMVKKIAPNAIFVSSRKNYDNFTEVAPEPFTDADNDGVRDPGECFYDQNANGVWDADPGAAGQGGASAVTLYTMTATYPRLFPVARLFGWSSTQTITSTTLLKNQPYATQNTTEAGTDPICT